ncbi:hypothetical protein P5W99_25860 [Paraburkholderia sp. A3BS-1L]|uniref:hypothetical protein n=1 Tax=Paraburkholderia sp. A3BS-1L TaxID=3028375 RepID=UPI003DA7A7BD
MAEALGEMGCRVLISERKPTNWCLSGPPEDIVAWARERMSSYRAPRIAESVESLPKLGSRKRQGRLCKMV